MILYLAEDYIPILDCRGTQSFRVTFSESMLVFGSAKLIQHTWTFVRMSNGDAQVVSIVRIPLETPLKVLVSKIDQLLLSPPHVGSPQVTTRRSARMAAKAPSLATICWTPSSCFWTCSPRNLVDDKACPTAVKAAFLGPQALLRRVVERLLCRFGGSKYLLRRYLDP